MGNVVYIYIAIGSLGLKECSFFYSMKCVQLANGSKYHSNSFVHVAMYVLLCIFYRSFDIDSVAATAIKDKIIEEDEVEIRPEILLASYMPGWNV